MKIEFIKVHGSQNDFFIIDERRNQLTTWSDKERQVFAKKITARASELGGADGVLFVSEAESGQAIGKMRVFNADGSEASMCGNGLRTVARYLLEMTGQKRAKVDTLKATLEVAEGESLGYEIPTFEVEISPVLFAPEALPFNHRGQLFNELMPEIDPELRFSALAVPNPHLVTFVDQKTLASDKQEKIARYLNGENPYFPDGVNVSFVRRMTDQAIFVRTYERGVGFTNACGTAMSASSLIKKLLDHDKLEAELDVYNDGGRVKVKASHDEQTDQYRITLIGNATFTSTGMISYEEGVGIEILRQEETDEEKRYLRMVQEVQQFLAENEA